MLCLQSVFPDAIVKSLSVPATLSTGMIDRIDLLGTSLTGKMQEFSRTCEAVTVNQTVHAKVGDGGGSHAYACDPPKPKTN